MQPDPTLARPALVHRGSCRPALPHLAAIRLGRARLRALQRKRDDETEFAKFQEEKAEMSRKKDEATRLQQAACSMQPSTCNIRMRHATGDMQMQHTRCNMRHAACNMLRLGSPSTSPRMAVAKESKERHLNRDRARACRICTGTALALASDVIAKSGD